MDTQARRAVPERADDEGRGGQRLDHVGVARHRRRRRACPKDVETKLVTAIKKIWDSKEFKDFATSKGYGIAVGAAGRLRDVHGEGRRRHGRRHEGGRPREVTHQPRPRDRAAGVRLRHPARRRGSSASSRDAGRRMRGSTSPHEAQRRGLRRDPRCCSARSCSCTCRRFRRFPASRSAPRCSRASIAAGFVVCGVLLIVSGASRPRRRSPWFAAGAVDALAAARAAFLALIVAGNVAYILARRARRLPDRRRRSCCSRWFLRASASAWTTAIVAAVITTLVIWYAFYKLLRVPLPWGVLTKYAF